MDRKIILDGGLVPVARIKNQTLLDTLLDLELIEVREHLAGEYVAEQCLKAGIHIKAVNFDGMPLGGGNHKNHYNGMMPLRRTLRLVKKKCGTTGAEVLIKAVASDMLRASNLDLLKKSLLVVSDNRLSFNG